MTRTGDFDPMPWASTFVCVQCADGDALGPNESCAYCGEYKLPGPPRPVQNENGTWDAADETGCGHALGFASAELVQAWLDGYDAGARENM